MGSRPKGGLPQGGDNHNCYPEEYSEIRTDGGEPTASAGESSSGFLPAVVREHLLVQVVLVLVGGVLVASLVAGYFYLGISDDLDQQVERQTIATTEQHADVYDRWVKQREEELKELATEIQVDDEANVREILRRERLENDQVSHLHYVAVDSGEIVSSSNDHAGGETVPFEQTVLTQQVFVSPERYTSFDNRTVFAIGQGVPFQERVILAEFDVSEAGPTVYHPLQGASTSLVTAGGERLIGPPIPSAPPSDVDTDTTVEQTDDFVVGYKKLSSVDLVVVTPTPVDSAFDVRDAVLRSFGVTIVLTFAVLIGAVVVGSRSILRDVTRISTMVQEISDGNLDVSVQTSREDEIGQLYHGVDEMRNSLATRIVELQRQNERLDKFASVVSHDLRNPLTVAQLHTELVRQEHDSENADKIEESLERMETMIEELLTMARAETTAEDFESIHVGEFATSAWRTVQTDDATLRTEEGIVLHGDPDLLRNVFENLFRNALEHNEPPVTVTVGALEGQEGFYIEDDGSGIPESRREQIFDHGYTTNDDGTGFGLSIVKELVAAHGWSVSVTEGSEGGARFEIVTGGTERSTT